ncbi:MAG: hypothetical protein KY392_01410 [Chloroflexi bacterium]|nr:hypothetical protein [Chloroflexota bacterium]
MSHQQVTRFQQRRREIEEDLNQTIEDTIRTHGPINALAWLAVAGGGFLLNLGVLVWVTGG